MTKINITDKVFFISLILLSLTFIYSLVVLNLLPSHKAPILLVYMSASVVYLFNIIFLKTVKNIFFWKWFLYAGIIVLAYKDFMVIYTNIMTPEKEIIAGIVFINVVFLLFLYANYQYVFNLSSPTK